MVFFTSITKGVFLVSTVMIALSNAVPTDEGRVKKNLDVDKKSALPPYIVSRVQMPIISPKKPELNSESINMERNLQFIIEKGIDIANMTQRNDIGSLFGMTLDMPANILPFSTRGALSRLDKSSSQPMILASPDQVSTFELYAGVASTAYCRSVTGLARWNCKNCLKYVPDGKIVTKFSSPLSDVTGFVLRSDEQKTIHVVFRGTQSIRNAIIENFSDKMDYDPVKGAKVHSGWYKGYKEIVDHYFPYVQEQLFSYPDYKVVVLGHSFGGAEALLAGLDLFQRETRISTNNLSIYVFGSPRVGDSAFAYYVDSTGIPFYRSVHNRDVFSHFPTQQMGYLHPGVELWEVPGEGVHICTSKIENKFCSNTVVPFTSLMDHTSYYGINEGLCL